MEMKQERKVKRWREYFSGAKDPFGKIYGFLEMVTVSSEVRLYGW